MATETEAESGNRRPTMKERFRAANAGSQFKTGAGSVAGILATIVMVIAFIAAGILVLHIVFTMFKGNGGNNIVRHVSDYANSLAGPLKDLFTFKNPKTNTLINFGIAAAIWVAGGRLIASLLQRIKT
ncbi:MAG: hypothetical protein QOJ32_3001 [Frankiaceae bacterium]|jgi:hypothetical protein|nr:hypothetical protein [Frankiaceae bacterium]MDQ1636192.1 hypothetical protein [Frankiaceae bacterium]MDQ1650278.1 hypothetical protein [Frankiaceae bacterium]MDQ1671892.1 hypothetical protein [Frankiaceae bacterium]